MPENLESSRSWEIVRDRLAYDASVPRPEDLDAARYLFESAHVRIKHELADYAEDCFSPGTPVLVGAQALMAKIFKEFKFDPEATTVSTPIMEVLEKKRGVCQAFAHLTIGYLLPNTEHITVAIGRDFSGISPLRGIILGGVGAEPEVKVTVTPLDEEAPPAVAAVPTEAADVPGESAAPAALAGFPETGPVAA